MNLYEINQGIMNCMDAETGEIIDAEKLDALLMQREEKVESVALWVKNLQADAMAYKAEKESFAQRQAVAEAKIDSLKKWLVNALNGQKFSTGKCAVSFRKSVAVEITDDKLIPKALMVETVTEKPDKAAIKELLKAGTEVAGCVLVENTNPQIK